MLVYFNILPMTFAMFRNNIIHFVFGNNNKPMFIDNTVLLLVKNSEIQIKFCVHNKLYYINYSSSAAVDCELFLLLYCQNYHYNVL